MKKLLLVFVFVSMSFLSFGQIKIYDPKVINYRKNLTSIDSLMKNGIMTDKGSGLTYFTGYSYKTLYDWDQYFEGIVQIYMGWPSVYIKNGVLIFLANQNDSGFISRSVPGGSPFQALEHVKPFLAQISLMVYKAYGEKDWILEESKFDKLKKYLDYWLYNMDINKNGLSEWMSAPHTGMDNQHERAGYWMDRQCEGVDLNCYLVRECRAFAKLAKLKGKDKLAKEYETIANERTATIQKYLWDEKDGFFYDQKLNPKEPMAKSLPGSKLNALTNNKSRIPVKTIGAFAAIWAGVATPEQAKRMITEHLLNPHEFWTAYPIPALAKSELWYSTVPLTGDLGCSWRANTWMPTNYMLYHASNNYGYGIVASAIAQRTNELMQKAGNREYYNSETGEGCGLNPFWGWSLLGHFFNLEESLDWDITSLE